MAPNIKQLAVKLSADIVVALRSPAVCSARSVWPFACYGADAMLCGDASSNFGCPNFAATTLFGRVRHFGLLSVVKLDRFAVAADWTAVYVRSLVVWCAEDKISVTATHIGRRSVCTALWHHAMALEATLA